MIELLLILFIWFIFKGLPQLLKQKMEGSGTARRRSAPPARPRQQASPVSAPKKHLHSAELPGKKPFTLRFGGRCCHLCGKRLPSASTRCPDCGVALKNEE